MTKMAAQSMLSEFWDGNLPVNPAVIARAAGIAVRQDPELGTAVGRIQYEGGLACIDVHPDTSALRQRFVIAHELGHFMLHGGARFVDVEQELEPIQLDIRERQANLFALELLIPSFAVEILIYKRKIFSLEKLRTMFGVTDKALHYKLRRLGWLP